MSWYRLSIDTDKKLQYFSSILIIASTILITAEITSSTIANQHFFDIVDSILVFLFTYEIILRHKNHDKDVFERVWYYFDICLLVLGYLSFLKGFFTHPETIYILRLFRITRIFRLFELSDKLKSIEKKIFHVIPSVIVFGILLSLLLFVYSLLGMSMFDKKQFDLLNFNSLYESIRSLFFFITSGLDAAIIKDVSINSPNIPKVIIDVYFFSFFICTTMITLNVFLAVMTNSIQEEVENDIKKMDQENDLSIEKLHLKVNQILEEIKILKNKD